MTVGTAHDGCIVVGFHAMRQVRRVSLAAGGTITTLLGSSVRGQVGPGSVMLNNPRGVAVGGMPGAVYVADLSNHRVLRTADPVATRTTVHKLPIGVQPYLQLFVGFVGVFAWHSKPYL